MAAQALLVVVGVAGVLVASWQGLTRWLVPDRGIDLTDEGLYLLAAQAPSVDASYGFPFGWHTAPLFRAVGFDVSAFRTLGALLLVGAAALLGAAVLRLGQIIRTLAGSSQSPPARRLPVVAETIVGGLLGGLGGLLYYGGLLRTPSYNWVNIFGATVASLGLILILKVKVRDLGGNSQTCDELRPRRSPLRERAGLAGAVLLAGFGTFLTVPAKPTTPIWFAVLAAAPLLKVGGRRFLARTLVAISGTAVLLALLAVATGLWSPRVLSIFLRAVAAPSLLEDQSILGALAAVPRFPVEVASAPRPLAMMLALIAFYVSGRLRATRGAARRARFFPPWVPVGFAALAAAIALVLPPAAVPVLGIVVGAIVERYEQHRLATIAAFSVGLLLHGSPLVHRILFDIEIGPQLAQDTITHDAVVVALGIAFASLAPRARGTDRRDPSRRALELRQALSASLMLLAVATAFGSGSGLVRQASLASGLLVAGLLTLAGAQPQRRLRTGAMTITTLFIMGTLTTQLIGNQNWPYRGAPIAEQVVDTPVGIHEDRLLLDQAISRMFVDLEHAARVAGWEPGTPMLALASPWSSTLPWHLGARVPDSLMLTLGGYGEASDDLFQFNLDWAIDDDFDNAWILISGEEHDRRLESFSRAQIAATRIGRTFPDDYKHVFALGDDGGSPWVRKYGDVELWRPRAP